jgi:hypothetical protein
MAGTGWTPWVPYWLPEDPTGGADPTLDPSGAPAPAGPELAPPPVPTFGVDPALVPPPVDQEPPPIALQPGLGVPAPFVDQAAAAPAAPPEVAFPPVDAITGGAPAPTLGQLFDPANPNGVGELRVETPEEAASTAGSPIDPYDSSGNPLANPNLGQPELDANMVEIARTDPHRFAVLLYQHNQDQQRQFAEGLAAAEHQNQLRLEQNLADRQRAVEEANAKGRQLDEEVQRIASTKIDPNRWWSSRSAGQHIASFIGAIAGGYAGGASGRNSFLDEMNRSIDRDIDAQKQDLANGLEGVRTRRGIVADVYARTGDLYQAQEAARIGALASVKGELLARQQLFDPRGTQALGMAQTIAAVDGRIAAARAAADKAALDRALALAADRRKQIEADDKHRAAMAKLAARGGASTKARPVTPTYAAWLKKDGGGIDGPAARAAFTEVLANTQRQQAKWDAAQRGAGASSPGMTPRGASLLTDVASASVAPTGGVPTGHAQVPSAPVASAGAGAPAVNDPTTTTAQNGTEQAAPTRYTKDSDWFEANAPDASAEQRDDYWFPDGDHGNEVPPIKIGKSDDATKFQRRNRLRWAMGVKADKLRMLTARLQKKGFWQYAKNNVGWLEDADYKEARALAENLKGDVIIAKEMGVPSGNDVERVTTMMGGDPGGWSDPTPALQNLREAMQDEQNADWNVYAPEAARDPRYNSFRILPSADRAWVEKFQRRGEVKTLGAEYANTDPKQLKPKAYADDAPNVEEAEQNATYFTNAARGEQWWEESGIAPRVESDERADALAAALGVKQNASVARPVPQEDDFRGYEGPPGGRDPYRVLAAQFVNSFRNLDEYQRTRDPKDWSSFETNKRLMREALVDYARGTGRASLYDAPYRATGKRFDDNDLARLVGDILRSKGRR